MEEMSWLEISEALKSGVNTAIIPLGSVEQHGHHLPLLTDTIEAHYLSEMIAQEVGFALVAPAIRPGYSEHHMDFPGTISLRLETLASIIRDYCASLIHHGFKNIVMLNCHGGNIPVLSAVAAEFAMAHAKDGITVISIVDVLSEIFTAGIETRSVTLKAGLKEYTAGSMRLLSFWLTDLNWSTCTGPRQNGPRAS